MGKFRQISPELRPLIYATVLFLGSILSICRLISLNFVKKFISGRVVWYCRWVNFVKLNVQSYSPWFCLKFETHFPMNAIKIFCEFVLNLVSWVPVALLFMNQKIYSSRDVVGTGRRIYTK